MQHISIEQQTHILEHTGAHYTAQEIASEHTVGESTVRTRWFQWLCKVAPAEILKTKEGYTELARTLYREFANTEKRDRKQWVSEAKQKYSAEWSSVGVIEGELMPEEVGSVLATMSVNNTSLSQQIQIDTNAIEGFIADLNSADASLSQAEIEQYQAQGVKRALVQYQVEESAKAQTLNVLRKKRLEGK